ncbi:MAG: dTDP-glucose 4,6-dehydratase [Planctomycetes bacterium]|nr:dTDP-glucose 4,6-dehydratase [Planctomycetota bacterium]
MSDRTILVTGGCGFIGSNFVRHLMDNRPDVRVVNLDKLTYAGNPENLAGFEGDPRYRFVRGDVSEPADVARAMEGGVDEIVNFAAESHVDRSILDSRLFVKTNVVGTQVLLEAARRAGVSRFIQIGTDEVYGDLGGPEGLFTEETPLAPNSPYSASKAAADLLVRSYFRTYGLPAIVTRCSNNYGPFQYPEKLIPLLVTNALDDRPLPIYGDGLNVRDWIHVEDHCRALETVLERGRPGETYNIGGSSERTNLEVARAVLARLEKPESLLSFVPDRPGHDRRYAIDPAKVRRELGWEPRLDFATGIDRTARWYIENRRWWERIKSGEYREYYRLQYGPG